MLLQPTGDQEFFRSTTARFLAERVPPDELRRRRDDPSGLAADYWRQGAELGWTSLLVSESSGGGSISGRGVEDLTLIAHEFGWAAAPGPLATTNVVAAALSDTASHPELLAPLVAGDQVASWADTEPNRPGPAPPGLTIELDGDSLVLNGIKRPVESAADATFLLVTGLTDEAPTQVLVPLPTDGVGIEPLDCVDLTRRLQMVRFNDVRVPQSAAVGPVGGAADQIERQLQLALVIGCAESVGAMQHAFDMTVEWAFDRYSFGRPLASYQEIKHRFADMKMWLEAGHAVTDAAAAAVQDGAPDAGELASAAAAYVGQYGSALLQDCVQIHGGIGVTFEHDLHLYLRRGVLNQGLHGTPADHRRRVATFLERREAA